ncbi:hypothetical protein [Hydrogenophaga sp. PAMC20947]|uniref:hypothetical protein n=1 Tax=Hydrogenophaga sp. PAMC20947 TaxID=2565558 RepID=UPI00109E1B88|nr:hypothetical protein [Hydrogenophaga sp. PAMC20947]QCB45479.1 hypothetical protein E5678_05235 [Hydrogenophaga sp. PAMC20947]
MQPSDLQVAVSQGADFPWWALFAIVSASGVGAYLATYLAKKGEARALREDFESIRSQLKATTADAEEIKQALFGKSWRSQQQWSAREAQYRDLLGQLYTFKTFLLELSEFYLTPGSEHTPDNQMGPNFENVRGKAKTASTEIFRSSGTAAMYLSPEALASLDKLRSEHWLLESFGAVSTADYVHEAFKLASEAYENVLAEAKQTLGLPGGGA